MMDYRVLAIDPGTVKCGLAVVGDGSDRPYYRVVVPCREVDTIVGELVSLFAPNRVLLGRGTACGSFIKGLERAGLAVELVDERGSTLAARTRYYRAIPPRGLGRLIPAGLRLPRGPIDDWAAVVIAERYLTRRAISTKISLPRVEEEVAISMKPADEGGSLDEGCDECASE